MTAKILDGYALAAERTIQLKAELSRWQAAGGRMPGLAVILVGEDEASVLYTQRKHERCLELNYVARHYQFPEDVAEAEVINLVKELNRDPVIDGILVQLPLPKHWDLEALLGQIAIEKDVDGFNPFNVGQASWNWPGFISCTARGILQMLDYTKVSLEGANTLMIGASNLVGKPMTLELLKRNATVTVAHKFTKNLAELVQGADILISAVGHKHLIPGTWIKPGATVIDVGITRENHGANIYGDVEFEVAKERAAWITPVPGGVGPMTVQNLMENTWIACRHREQARHAKTVDRDF